jgi:hypothetical protein
MSNRVMNRRGARDLTSEEMDLIAGGSGGCLITACGVIGHPLRGDDVKCPD